MINTFLIYCDAVTKLTMASSELDQKPYSVQRWKNRQQWWLQVYNSSKESVCCLRVFRWSTSFAWNASSSLLFIPLHLVKVQPVFSTCGCSIITIVSHTGQRRLVMIRFKLPVFTVLDSDGPLVWSWKKANWQMHMVVVRGATIVAIYGSVRAKPTGKKLIDTHWWHIENPHSRQLWIFVTRSMFINALCILRDVWWNKFVNTSACRLVKLDSLSRLS